MIAMIPVAGVGTQLRPHTHTQPKPLIPVAGKPILGHIIESLLDAGITRQIFVVGYLRDKIKEYVLKDYGDKIDAEFVLQEPRMGLAHALWVAREAVGDAEEMVVNLGDTIFTVDVHRILELQGSALAVHQVDDPRNFGIAMLDEETYVKKLTEKPNIPTSNLALVGLYKIEQVPLLYSILGEMMSKPIKPGEEYTFTEALMEMVKKGVKFRTMTVENWFDGGHKKTLLQTNRILLERQGRQHKYQFHNTVIIPPVHIAEGCEINHSIIGPYVAIAEGARINYSVVRNTILGAYSRLESIILQNSVIGNDTSLRGKTNSINIGDNAEIDFEQ
ncbi:MAG: sugar phosphate nucleotidyltransferase [Bacteroidia bacterium]|nr:sugar phosphate nucleotidyltransferase [Bacteroidia bacterium]